LPPQAALRTASTWASTASPMRSCLPAEPTSSRASLDHVPRRRPGLRRRVRCTGGRDPARRDRGLLRGARPWAERSSDATAADPRPDPWPLGSYTDRV